MNKIYNKKILLIICGGIAAYKSLELIRLLKKNGASIKTILTKSAQKFVTPLSITSLSQNKIYTDLFDHESESEMDHISLSRWADIILIAPATANTISKLSNGIADDLASTVVLASNKKIFLAPSMNVRMWEHESTRKNRKKLNEYGYITVGPEIGDMACGEYGEGKMTEPINIFSELNNYFKELDENKNFNALVTAGPTIEQIDPVRFISNHSSGKQGYEIANALAENGYKTTLISGPTNLKYPRNVKVIKVYTADQMFSETIKSLPADVAIFSAAVSDFKVNKFSKLKIKKSEKFNLSLSKNKDILSYVSKHNYLRPKLVIGFAAETNDLERNSIDKLNKKNCDWIIANDVSNQNIGFNSDDNEVSIFYRNKNKEKIPKMKKSLLASEIVKKIKKELN
ncbi:MAG: bifunctional phosphopantothenoylcysteine decarboxylase/phosphopantothenate--cysteine ligase CoaBC [Candidatus Pelagibacter sp. TMED118]|nr:MAG: bifunctional phosphopantothenoylcysteine decarboxylase/phosphopantothenate--cysteine ligase CoaBC [Candidatus Pelagibacter sp. TMED118]|tara:strand:- start:2423 stop:3622 length:1200 start_codon:yes stop_codon:yes gene_type:complete